MNQQPALPSSSRGDLPEEADYPSGAFERFLTSAIAAILTILFSWRFLLDGEETRRQPSLEWKGREMAISAVDTETVEEKENASGTESGSTILGVNEETSSRDTQQILMDPPNSKDDELRGLPNQHYNTSGAFQPSEDADVIDDKSFDESSLWVSREPFYSSCPGTCTVSVKNARQQELSEGCNAPEHNGKITNDAPCIQGNYRDGVQPSRGEADMYPREPFGLPSTDRHGSYRIVTSTPGEHISSETVVSDQAYDSNINSVAFLAGSNVDKASDREPVLSQRGAVDAGVCAGQQHTIHVNIESEFDAAAPSMAYNKKLLGSESGTGVGTHGTNPVQHNYSNNKCVTLSSDQSGKQSAGEVTTPKRGAFQQNLDEERLNPGVGFASGNMDSVRQRCQEILEKHNQIKDSLYRDHYSTVVTSDSFENSNSSEDEEDGTVPRTAKKYSDSDSENESFSTNYYGEREYVLSEPLGEDSSDSEYCIIFRRVLEAITEEDTDDLDTTADTDAEVHDIPADDESGGVSDNQGETVAIGNRHRPFTNGSVNNSSSASGDPRPRINMNNSLRETQLAIDGTQLALIDENKREDTHERASSVDGLGRCPPGGVDRAESSSRATIYRAGVEQGTLHSQRHEAISRQMNIHMDNPSPMNKPEEEEPLEEEVEEELDSSSGSSDAVKEPSIQEKTETDNNSSSVHNPSGQSVRPQSSCDLSDTDLASDTNSIDVAVDFDPEKIKEAERLRCYGGWVNTHRPVTIGPYHDRQSEFARRSYITVHSPGDISPRSPGLEEGRGDLGTPRDREHKCGLEAALAKLEQGVARGCIGRHENAGDSEGKTDTTTDGDNSKQSLDDQAVTETKIHSLSDRTPPSTSVSTTPEPKSDIQCKINVIAVASPQGGHGDSSRNNNTVSLHPDDNKPQSPETSDIDQTIHLLEGHQQHQLSDEDIPATVTVLHQAKSLREAALDAVNAPPHDDYYLQSQYYDCKPSVSSNSLQDLPQRPQQQALPVSPAPSFARSSETDTTTDLEFDSAEDSSFSSRYRTPEADSYNEEQWTFNRVEENATPLPVEYTGRHGDGYILEHWEETGNNTGSYVVDLKVDVHHLGTDTEPENELEELESRSYEQQIDEGKQQIGTEEQDEDPGHPPKKKQEKTVKVQVSEIEKHRNIKEDHENASQDLQIGRQEYELDTYAAERRTEEQGEETEEPRYEKEGQTSYKVVQSEGTEVQNDIKCHANVREEDGEQVEEQRFMLESRTEKEDHAFEIQQHKQQALNKNKAGEVEIETGFPCEKPVEIGIKTRTSVTERPLNIGPIPSKTGEIKHEIPPLDIVDPYVYKSDLKETMEEEYDTQSTTENPDSESEDLMDAKLKAYQELEELQDFKGTEQNGEQQEANKGQADKPEAGSQQSKAKPSGADGPLDARSQEAGFAFGGVEIEKSQPCAMGWGDDRERESTIPTDTSNTPPDRDIYVTLLKGDNKSDETSIRPINTLQQAIDQGRNTVSSESISACTHGPNANSYVHEGPSQLQVSTGSVGASTSNTSQIGGGAGESSQPSELHTHSTTIHTTSSSAIPSSSSSCTGGTAVNLQVGDPGSDSELDSSSRYIWGLDTSINVSLPKQSGDHADNVTSAFKESSPEGQVVEDISPQVESATAAKTRIEKNGHDFKERSIVITERPAERKEVVLIVSKHKSITEHSVPCESDYSLVDTGNLVADQDENKPNERSLSGVGLPQAISENKQDHDLGNITSQSLPIAGPEESVEKPLIPKQECPFSDPHTAVSDDRVGAQSRVGDDRNDFDNALGKVLSDIKSRSDTNTSKIRTISERAEDTTGHPGNEGMPGYDSTSPQSMPSRVIYQHSDPIIQGHLHAGRQQGSDTDNKLYDSEQRYGVNVYNTSNTTATAGGSRDTRPKHFVIDQQDVGVARDQTQYRRGGSGGSLIPTGIFYTPDDPQVWRQGTGVIPAEYNGSVGTVRPSRVPGGVQLQLPHGYVNNQHPAGAGNMGNQQDTGIHYANEIHIDPNGEYGFHPMHYEREAFSDKYDLYYNNEETIPSGDGGIHSPRQGNQYGKQDYNFLADTPRGRDVYNQQQYRESNSQDRQSPQRKPDYVLDSDYDRGYQPQVKYASIKKTNDQRGSTSGPPLSPRSFSGSWIPQDPHAYLDRSYQDIEEKMIAGGYYRIDPAIHRDLHHGVDHAPGINRHGYNGYQQASLPQHIGHSRDQIFVPHQYQDAGNRVNTRQGHPNYSQANRPREVPVINQDSWTGSDHSSGHLKSPPWRSDRSPSRSPVRSPTRSPTRSPNRHTPPPPPPRGDKSVILPRSHQRESESRVDTRHLAQTDEYDLGSPTSRSCTALATSTALARKDTGRYEEDRISPGDASKSVVSAIGNAEATGENPYIAVARATARAATIASAHAAAGVAKMPPTTSDDESGSDINVVISTSCTIKNEQSPRLEDDSRNVIKVMDVNQPSGEFQNSSLNYSPRQTLPGASAHRQQLLRRDGSIEGPKKMLITIEQQGTQEKRSRTVECELPIDPRDDDLSRAISGAVKRILTSSSTTKSPNIGGKQLNDIIEQVTQQVVRAYMSEYDNSGEGDKKRTQMYEDRNKYQYRNDPSPTRNRPSPVISETVPAFRAPRIDRETYRQMHKVHRKDDEDDDLAKYAVPVNSLGQRLQYMSPSRGRSKSPEPSHQPATKEDQTYFFVTGTESGNRSPVRQQGEVILKVMKDNDLQPQLEHVSLSEAESSSEAGTPRVTRKSHELSSGGRAQQAAGGHHRHTYVDVKTNHISHRGASMERGTSKNEPAVDTVVSPRKIKGILRTSPRVDQQVDRGGEYRDTNMDFRAKSPQRRYGTMPETRYQKKPSNAKQVERKPYDSILLRPVQDKPTPLSVAKKFADQEKPVSGKRSKLDDARKGYLDLVPKNPPWPKETVLDAAFEEKKKRWFKKSAGKDSTRKGGFMVVDINIDQESFDNKKVKSQSSDDLKRRLSAAKLKAPNSSEIDQRWQSLAKLKPYKSHGNLLEEMSKHESPVDFTKRDRGSSTSTADLRRAKSLGTLPSQFFANKRSYTSLLETDLDTGVCTETPLIYETDLDGISQHKARSLTNLSMKTSMVPVDIDEERRKSLETLPREGSGLMYSLPPDNDSDSSTLDTSQERSLSAGELRITESLNKLSIPNWYRQSFGKGKKPVELTHTRQLREGSFTSDSPDSSFEFQRREEANFRVRVLKDDHHTPKPIIIQHRVSNTIRAKSPIPSSPSALEGNQGHFELPSSKLKSHHVELKPVEIKPVRYPPVQIPKKNSAKEAYLRLKAQSQSQQDILDQANQDNQSSSGQNRDVNGVKDDRFTTTSYIRLTPRSIPGEKSKKHSSDRDANKGSKSSSKQGHDGSQKKKAPKDTQYSGSAKRYEPGATCSELVHDMRLDPEPDSERNNAASAVYSSMLDNIETKRKEIQERAHIISTDKSVPPGLMNRDENELTNTRKSFPVLSYNDSPSSRRTKSEHAEKNGSNNELSISKGDSLLKSPRATSPRNWEAKKESSLDSVIGGLLAIPSTSDPTSPSSEEDDTNLSPKKRVFRLLKSATTPRGSMTSVNTSKSHDNLSDTEDIFDYNLTEQAYEKIDPEFALDLYPKHPEKCTEEAAIVKCRNPKCKKATLLPEARNTYKTCHNCFTYYCGRECRKAHWERHKRKCLFSRVNSVCKHIVKKVHDTPAILEEVSRVARTGYMSKGRGCVLIAFTSPEKADYFLKNGARELEAPPGYANLEDLKEVSNIFAEHYFELVDMCKTYNPEIKFVIEVAVVSGQEVPAWPIPRREGPAIKKCAKLRLSTAPTKTALTRGEPETLILTAVPGSEFTENMEEKKAREICFVNIQRKLRQRGVSLRHHFPDVYGKLCAYVSENAPFTPMTIYPIDANTGKRFMCLIMPNSEPEVGWMHSPDLLDELGLATQV